jgi:hypothetical protein
MKKYFCFLPLLLLVSCISLEDHANDLQKTLNIINFDYKEFTCNFAAYNKTECHVSKPNGEIHIFICRDNNCYLELNYDDNRVKRVK